MCFDKSKSDWQIYLCTSTITLTILSKQNYWFCFQFFKVLLNWVFRRHLITTMWRQTVSCRGKDMYWYNICMMSLNSWWRAYHAYAYLPSNWKTLCEKESYCYILLYNIHVVKIEPLSACFLPCCVVNEAVDDAMHYTSHHSGKLYIFFENQN